MGNLKCRLCIFQLPFHHHLCSCIQRGKLQRLSFESKSLLFWQISLRFWFPLPCSFDWVPFVSGSAEERSLEELCSVSSTQDLLWVCLQPSVLVPRWEERCQHLSSEQLSGPGPGSAGSVLVMSPIITMPPTFLFQRGDQRVCGVAAPTSYCVLRFP